MTQRSSNKVSAYLENDVLEALELFASTRNRSKSLVINDALRVVLVPSNTRPNTDQDDPLYEKLSDQIALRARMNHVSLQVIREMLGVFVRLYLNHTPPIPAEEQREAFASGRARFDRFLAVVQNALDSGQSIFPPPPEVPPEVPPDTPPDTPPEAPPPEDDQEGLLDSCFSSEDYFDRTPGPDPATDPDQSSVTDNPGLPPEDSGSFSGAGGSGGDSGGGASGGGASGGRSGGK